MPAGTRKRYFTVEEANQRLPLVRSIVGDIVELFRDVHDRRDRLERVRQAHGRRKRDDDSPYAQEVREAEADLERDIARLEGFAEELRELGAELKDPVTGLIDFRALVDGREVYLCWKLGEGEINWWHELDSGFPGRQPLDDPAMFVGDEEE